MTRRRDVRADEDPALRLLAELLRAGLHARRQDLDAAPREGRPVDREENLAMIADSVGFLVARGQARRLRRRALLRRLPRRPRLRAARACARRPTPAPRTSSLCDTNGVVAAAQVAAAVRAVRRGARRRGRSASTATTTPGCGVANSLAAVEAGAVLVQGTMNGYGERSRQRQPRLDRPQPAAQARATTACRPSAWPASPRPRTSSTSCSTSRPTPTSPTWAATPSRTRAGCTSPASTPTRRPSSTSTRRPSATAASCSISELAGRGTVLAQRRGRRPRARRRRPPPGRRAGQGARARAASSSRPPTARSTS